MTFSKHLCALIAASAACAGRADVATDLSLKAASGPSIMSACSNNVFEVPRDCHPSSPGGIFYTRNNDGVIREFNRHEGLLQVANSERLAVQICNLSNLQVRQYIVALGTTLIPTVVGDIGNNGQVRVEVVNSGNIRVSSDRNADGLLIVGRRIEEGEQTEDAPDASLISEIVKGSLGQNAEINVSIQDSANIVMQGSRTQLWVGKGTLLQEVVNVEPAQFVRSPCIDVSVTNSANVDDVSGGARVYIRDGQLDDETVDLPSYCTVGIISRPCLGNDGRTDDATLVLRKDNVANVRGVAELSIWDGELSDESVDVGELTDSRVNINFDNVGNAEVRGYMSVVDGELVDEMFDSTSISLSDVNIVARNLGNARASTLNITEGELVDEIVDVEQDLSRSFIRVNAVNVGNAATTNLLYINEAELIDEVLDVSGRISNSEVQITLDDASNSKCGGSSPHRLTIEGGELLDSVVDVLQIAISSTVHVNLQESANAYTLESNINFVGDDATLMDPIIDESLGSCSQCSTTVVGSNSTRGTCLPTPPSCSNSCRFAFDRDCDDGGPGADYAICNYGTDCYDCCMKTPDRGECIY